VRSTTTWRTQKVAEGLRSQRRRLVKECARQGQKIVWYGPVDAVCSLLAPPDFRCRANDHAHCRANVRDRSHVNAHDRCRASDHDRCCANVRDLRHVNGRDQAALDEHANVRDHESDLYLCHATANVRGSDH
jgi:hypothetical protein